MAQMIFVNLPVADVAQIDRVLRSDRFENNPQVQQRTGVVDDVVGLDRRHAADANGSFRPSRPSRSPTPAQPSCGLFALSFDSHAEVDAIIDAAIAAGGTRAARPEDMGFMYSRAFEDPDGHGFGPLWMDPAAAEAVHPNSRTDRGLSTACNRRIDRCRRFRLYLAPVRSRRDRRVDPRLSARSPAVRS